MCERNRSVALLVFAWVFFADFFFNLQIWVLLSSGSVGVCSHGFMALFVTVGVLVFLSL